MKVYELKGKAGKHLGCYFAESAKDALNKAHQGSYDDHLRDGGEPVRVKVSKHPNNLCDECEG